jgi:NitT/TauT family transport system ATP-binding protein
LSQRSKCCTVNGGREIRVLDSAEKIAFEDVSHTFRTAAVSVHVIDKVSFEVKAGRFTAVIGPSGCGKSTLLQMLAGLLKPSSGRVRHAGREVTQVNSAVGFVPQQALLFPWNTLAENVGLPLVFRKVAPADRKARVGEALAAVGLEGFGDHYPHQLSGGMQKRGSIARTLVYRPDVILMDEPFGALDAQTRMIMQDDLQRLVRKDGTTVLFITHDITEAVLLADEVIVLGRRPARIIARVPIDLPRPRNVFEPFANEGFDAAYRAVWSRFRDEVFGADPTRMPA